MLGASGYIGSHLVKSLISTGAYVIGLDREGPAFRAEGYQHEIVDLEDQEAWHSLDFCSDASAFFHLATSSDMVSSFASASEYKLRERKKSKNLLGFIEKSNSNPILIFASSCSVYGNTGERRATELDQISPISPYAESKVEIENIMRDFAYKNRTVSIGVARFFNVIGRDSDSGLRERHEPETHVLPLVVKAALTGGIFSLYGYELPTTDGSPIRDYVDVRDICKGMILAEKFLSKNPNLRYRIWNLASDEPMSVLDLVTLVGKVSERKVSIIRKEPRIGDPAAAIADNTRAREELGWLPNFTVFDSIQSLIER